MAIRIILCAVPLFKFILETRLAAAAAEWITVLLRRTFYSRATLRKYKLLTRATSFSFHRAICSFAEAGTPTVAVPW